MNDPCEVYDEPTTVTTRLAELGLEAMWLRNAVERGVGEVLACTNNDPHQLPGILGWGRITRSLREDLITRKGFKRVNRRGQASTDHPEGTFAIVVAAGNEDTGRRYPGSETRSTKGPATELLIHENTRSLWWDRSDPEWTKYNDPEQIIPPRQTWMLLYYIDRAAGEVRLELSLPLVMDDSGYVVKWRKRIIIESFALPTDPLVDIAGDDDDDGEDGIAITRKMG